MITAGADGAARLYPWETFAPRDALLALAEERVRRPLTAEERRTYLHQ